MKIFSLLDVKANYFHSPFSDKTTVDAIRGFTSIVNKKGTVYNDYPDDYALCELATFNDNTGQLDVHQNPINLTTGRPLLKADQPTGSPLKMAAERGAV